MSKMTAIKLEVHSFKRHLTSLLRLSNTKKLRVHSVRATSRDLLKVLMNSGLMTAAAKKMMKEMI